MLRQRAIRSIRILVLVTGTFLSASVATTSSTAADIPWTNSAGGSFQEPANWAGGVVPGIVDRALFDLDEEYTVDFSGRASLTRSHVTTGHVTFNLDGNELTDRESVSPGGFMVRGSAGVVPTAIVRNGTLTVENINIGNATDVGKLILTDACAANVRFPARVGLGELIVERGSQVNCLGAIVGDLSASGTGTLSIRDPGSTFVVGQASVILEGGLYVTNGALLNSGDFLLSGDSGPTTFIFDGVGTQCMVGGIWGVGEGAHANQVTVSGGATVLARQAYFGIGSGSVAVIDITDSGSTLNTDQIVVAGFNSPGGQAIVNIGNATFVGADSLFRIWPQGTVNLNGGSLTVGSFDNQGTFNWNSGSFTITGGGGLTLGVGSPSGNNLSVSAGRALNITNNAQIAAQGSLTVESGGSVDVGGTAQVATLGMLQLNGGTIAAEQIMLSGGTLSGDGQTSGLLTNGGLVVPGMSSGLLQHTGDYQQLADGVLQMEIAGVADHDVLEISGAADLAGTLELSLLGGYQPRLGDKFELLSAASLSGQFDELMLPELDPALAWSVEYAPDGVALAVSAVPEPATWLLLSVTAIAMAALRRIR